MLNHLVEIVSLASGLLVIITVFVTGLRTGNKITNLQSDLSEGQSSIRSEMKDRLDDHRKHIEKKLEDENRAIRTSIEDMNTRFSDLRLEIALETVKKQELTEVKSEINGNLRSYGGEIMMLRDRIVRIETKQELRE